MSEMRVQLRRGKARPLWAGHPWIYAGAIGRIEGDPEPGALVAVDDAAGRRIGWGHLGGSEVLRVRMLVRDAQRPDEAAVVHRRIARAAALRRLLDLPSEATNVFRVVYSEGDGLPGLVVDRLGDGVVVQLGTPAMARLEGTIVDAVRTVLSPRWIVVQVPEMAAELEHMMPRVAIEGADPDGPGVVQVREWGLVYRVDPLGGQKTGLYADHRLNRRRVAELARGRRVLDAYCYGAAFALNAAVHGGARHVVAVDSSPRAVELARAHATLNGANIEVVCEDTVRLLRRMGPDRPFDLVVLDPPRLARTRASVPDAIKKYRKINELAIRSLSDGGLLVTASCSGHVTEPIFLRMLVEAALEAGRGLQVLAVTSQGPDHPVPAAAPEGRYLVCVFARVHDDA